MIRYDNITWLAAEANNVLYKNGLRRCEVIYNVENGINILSSEAEKSKTS